jgi:hypothetical protein
LGGAEGFWEGGEGEGTGEVRGTVQLFTIFTMLNSFLEKGLRNLDHERSLNACVGGLRKDKKGCEDRVCEESVHRVLVERLS